MFYFLSATDASLINKYVVVCISAETANMFFDNNRRDVLDVLTPFIEEFCEELVLGVVNQILSAIPFEEMLI